MFIFSDTKYLIIPISGVMFHLCINSTKDLTSRHVVTQKSRQLSNVVRNAAMNEQFHLNLVTIVSQTLQLKVVLASFKIMW